MLAGIPNSAMMFMAFTRAILRIIITQRQRSVNIIFIRDIAVSVSERGC